MADEYKRINLLIGTQVELAAGQEEGMPGIVSDNAYRFGVYAAGAWRLMALRDTSERFSTLTVSNLTSSKIPVAGAGGLLGDSALGDDGAKVTCSRLVVFNASTGSAASIRIPVGQYLIVPEVGDIWAYANALRVKGLGIKSILAASDNIEEGAHLSLDAPGKAWTLQLGTNTDLAFWRYAGGWSKVIQFSADGRITQCTTEPVQSAQYVKTTTTTVTGTTTETSIINGGVAAGGWNAITVPAGRLNIAALLSDLKLKGPISSSGSTLVTWRVRVNGAVVATSAVTRNWGTSFWRIEGDGTTRTTGATGTRQWDIGLYANADNANAAISYYDLSWLGTLDLTAVVTLDVTVQLAATTTSVSCTTAFLKHS